MINTSQSSNFICVQFAGTKSKVLPEEGSSAMFQVRLANLPEFPYIFVLRCCGPKWRQRRNAGNTPAVHVRVNTRVDSRACSLRWKRSLFQCCVPGIEAAFDLQVNKPETREATKYTYTHTHIHKNSLTHSLPPRLS